MGTEVQVIEPLEGSTRLVGGGGVAGESLEEQCRLQEDFITRFQRNAHIDELQSLRESENRHKLQYEESQRRERILIRKLAHKEQEIQDYVAQIAELKAAQLPTIASLRSTLLDPAVNIVIQKLKTELQATKARLEETQNELSAWKFTPDSNTGKRLMAKCRLLYQENEELGKMTSNGRLAKLEGDLALQKSFCEEVKKSQSELDDFLQELDEDVEGMQSTILYLQQELKASKETISSLERENNLLKNENSSASTPGSGAAILSSTNNNTTATTSCTVDAIGITNNFDSKEDILISNALLNGTTNCSVVLSEKDVRINSERMLRKEKSNNNIKNEPRTLRSSTRNMSSGVGGSAVGGDDVLRTTRHRLSSDKCNGNTDTILESSNVSSSENNYEHNCNDKRTYDDDDVSDDSSESSSNSNGKIVRTKKVRRSSVLSIDLNEEDSQIEIDDDRTILPSTNGGGGGVVGSDSKERDGSSAD